MRFVTCPVISLALPLIAQTSYWTQRPTPTAPGGGQVACMAFDAARSQTVLLVFGATWTWDGFTWTQRLPAHPAPSRSGNMCFDSVRNRVVAVLGDPNNALQTWEWDGTDWQLRANGGISGRGGFGLAYDALHQETVLFGG